MSDRVSAGIDFSLKGAAEAARDLKELNSQLDRVQGKTDAITRADSAAAKKRVQEQEKAVQKIKQQAETLSNVAQMLPGPVGQVVQMGAQLQRLGGNLKSSMGEIAVAGPVAAIAVTALGAAFTAFTAQVADSTRALNAAMTGQITANRILTQGTTEDARKAIEAAQNERKAAEMNMATAQKVIDQLGGMDAAMRDMALPVGLGQAAADAVEMYNRSKAAIVEQTAVVGTLTEALNKNAFAAADAAAAAQKEYDARNTETKARLQATIDEAKVYLQAENMTMEAARAQRDEMQAELNAINDWLAVNASDPTLGKLVSETTARQKELTASLTLYDQKLIPTIKTNELAAARIKDLNKNLQGLADVTTQLGDVYKDRAKALEDQRRSDAREAQEAALQGQIDAARERESVKDDAAEIAKIKADAAASEQALTQSFMNDSLKALKDFQTNESRMQQDYDLARRREMEDLYNDLMGFASQRDVAGFIARQRAGNLSLARGAESYSIGAGRRAEDFAAAQEERARAFEEQLAQERQNAADELAAKREAGKKIVLESEQLEKQLSDLKAKWAAEDRARERKAAEAEYNQQVNDLLARQRLYSKSLEGVWKQPIAQVEQFAKSAKAWWDWLIGGTKSAAPSPSKGGGRYSVVANATGGIYDTPTLGMLGERPGYSDVVIPVSQSEGIEAAINRVTGSAGGRGVVYNDNRSFTVGDVASKADILDVLKQDRVEMFAGLEMAVRGASGV